MIKIARDVWVNKFSHHGFEQWRDCGLILSISMVAKQIDGENWCWLPNRKSGNFISSAEFSVFAKFANFHNDCFGMNIYFYKRYFNRFVLRQCLDRRIICQDQTIRVFILGIHQLVSVEETRFVYLRFESDFCRTRRISHFTNFESFNCLAICANGSMITKPQLFKLCLFSLSAVSLIRSNLIEIQLELEWCKRS